MGKKTKANNSSSPELKEALIKYFSGLLKELGIVNFIILFAAFFLTTFSSGSQKEKFIEKWFLLENENHLHCVIIIIFITLISVIGGIYFRKMLNLAKRENERIGQEKSDLQEKLLNFPGLSSSKP